MHERTQLMAVFAVLLATSLSCSVLSGGDSNTGQPDGLPPNVLFQDNFSDSSSGWDQVNATEGITDYEDGFYRIYVSTEDTDIWANPGLNFTDVVIEVDATKAGGPDDNDFGIICRYQDIENYYFLIISSDGYYGVGKVVNGEQELIGTDQMRPDEAIIQGDTTNHIRADCVGSHLMLHVNGTTITDVEDTAFSSGDVGLVAGTFTETGTDIHFDNFVVKKP